jgi:hypothetical protein
VANSNDHGTVLRSHGHRHCHGHRRVIW